MRVITHRSEEPYVNSTSTVLWELEGRKALRLPDKAGQTLWWVLEGEALDWL